MTPKRHIMTATQNPQTAADQARATYRRMTDQLGHLGLDTAVPEGVRALAYVRGLVARGLARRCASARPSKNRPLIS